MVKRLRVLTAWGQIESKAFLSSTIADNFISQYQSILPDDKNIKILDIGVGEGWFASICVSLGYTNIELADFGCSKKFLNIKNTLEQINDIHKTKPKVICITRFPRCDDSTNDASGVQDITSSIGYCGSTVVNLFGRNTLIELMVKFGYHVVFKDFSFEGDTDYFGSCDDINYRKMTLVAYRFVRSH